MGDGILQCPVIRKPVIKLMIIKKPLMRLAD